jgi:hypothetical protein
MFGRRKRLGDGDRSLITDVNGFCAVSIEISPWYYVNSNIHMRSSSTLFSQGHDAWLGGARY